MKIKQKTKNLWALVLKELNKTIKNDLYMDIFKNCFVNFDKNKLTIKGSKIAINLLQSDINEQLKETFIKVFQNVSINVEYEIIKDKDVLNNLDQKHKVFYHNDNLEIHKKELKLKKQFDGEIDKLKVFDNYIIHNGNRLAAVVGENFIIDYSLRFTKICYFFGSVGIGKTHLCQALCNKFKTYYPTKKIFYLDSNWLIFKYNSFVKNDLFDITFFLHFFESYDLLVLDDLQKLKGRKNINIILFSLINFMIEKNKKVIVVSHENLEKTNDFDASLRSRILSGLKCELKIPTYEVARILVNNFLTANAPNINFTQDAINNLAFILGSDIRIVFGHLATILFYLNNENESIIVDNKKIEALINQIGIVETIPTKNLEANKNYLAILCTKLKYNLSDIISNSRKQNHTYSRNIIIYVLKKKLCLTHKKIGELLKRDHTTISNSLKHVEYLVKNNDEFKNFINNIISWELSED